MREFYSIEDHGGEKWIHYHGFTWAREGGELPYALTEGAFCMCPIAEVVGDPYEHMAGLFETVQQYQADMAEGHCRWIEEHYFDGTSAGAELRMSLVDCETPCGCYRFDVEGA